jgi:hypothetical protein
MKPETLEKLKKELDELTKEIEKFLLRKGCKG